MKKFLFFPVVLLVLTSLSFAADERVARVDVVGTERIDRGIVTNVLKTKEGAPYDPSIIAEDLKSVYKTGFFTDVMVDTKDTDKGKAITFIVVERAPVSAISVSGNKKVRTEDIRDKIKARAGTVLNMEKVRESIDEIRKLYASKGYYATKVNYELETEPRTNQTAIRFVIEEAQRANVRKVTFVGNRNMKANQLKGVMRTREKGIFSWFTGSGILDEEAIDEDVKQIESFYADNGYVRAKVGSPDIRISKDGKTISITIPVEEGSLYKISDVAFSGDIVFDEAKVKGDLKSKTGNTFRSSLFREDLLKLTDLYQDKGFAFVDIAPLTQISDEQKTIGLVFDIEKGSEVYFNRINIVGNVRTRDKVVRRELKVAEGDLYSSTNLKESKRRLTNTTYFKNIELKTTKTDETDKINMDVLVEEKPTGTMSLGLGYSSYESFMVTGSVSQENIFGTGRKIYVNASLSSITHLYDLTVVDPYFLDYNLSTAMNLFNTKRYFDTYDYGGTGGSVTVGRPLTTYLTAALKYRYDNTKVSDVDADAGSYIKSQEGTSSTSSITASLSKNTIDDVTNPTRGTLSSISTEFAGGPLAGENQFVKGIVSYGRYFPWKYGTTFFLRGTGGTIRPYGGKTIPVYERFYVGGINTVRGFKYGEAGPLDPETDDVIGGLNELFFNAEFIFPVFAPAGLKGVVFFDYGKGFDKMSGFYQSLRPAAGFGIRWLSPIGPIRLELGFNLNKKSGEKGNVFDFTMGRMF